MAAWRPISGETPIDPSGLRDKSIGNRTQLNAAEGRNIAEAVYKYLIGAPSDAMAPFDLAWFVKLHAEMFGEVWEWAGTTRQSDLNLGAPWHQVETQLFSMIKDLEYWREMPLLEQAARLHHRAVSIHPFLNGNGRWSRMLVNIWLKLQGSPPTEWPEEVVGGASVIRSEYIAAVKAADTMEFEPLIALHRRYTPKP